MTERIFERPLTEPEMDKVKEAMNDGVGSGVSAFYTVVAHDRGFSTVVELFDWVEQEHGSVSPSLMAIPEEQWKELCQAALDRSRASDIGKVNAGLDYVNIGPSAYKPGEVS